LWPEFFSARCHDSIALKAIANESMLASWE